MDGLPERPEDFDAWYRSRKPDRLAEGERFEAWIDELQLSEAKLSEMIGRPRSYIQQRRALVHAAPEVQEAWRAGQINFTHAREIAEATNDLDVQSKTLRMVLGRIAAKKPVTREAIVMFARGASGA
jgi:hypothetical protein